MKLARNYNFLLILSSILFSTILVCETTNAQYGTLLLASTYLGGEYDEDVFGIELDGDENIIVAGTTSSENFPLVDAFQSSFGGGGSDIFITKFASDGRSLISSSFLGGNGTELSWSFTLDSDENILIAGLTDADDFPLVNPLYDTKGEGWALFLTKINSAGNDIIFSTFLGDSNYTGIIRLVTDSVGNILISGATSSDNFTLVNPIQDTYGGGDCDGFIKKISSDGQTLLYSSYLGGNSSDYPSVIECDNSDNVILTGLTYSADFPTLNANQSEYNSNGDLFLTSLSSDCQTMQFSTYFGGSEYEEPADIAFDQSNNIILGGTTFSRDFPVFNGLFEAFRGGIRDCYVTKFDDTGTPIFSTFFGGNFEEYLYGLTRDVNDIIGIIGYTTSNVFPIVNAYQIQTQGNGDSFIAGLSNNGQMVNFSSYFGGYRFDVGRGIVFDSTGSVHVTGITQAVDFPTANPYQASNGGSIDCFVSKLYFDTNVFDPTDLEPTDPGTEETNVYIITILVAILGISASNYSINKRKR